MLLHTATIGVRGVTKSGILNDNTRRPSLSLITSSLHNFITITATI